MFKKFTAFAEIPAERQKDALELKDGTFVVPEEATPADTSKLENALKSERKAKGDLETELAKNKEQLADLTRKLEAKEASGQQTDQKISEMLAKWEQDKQAAVSAAVKAVEDRYAPIAEKVTRYELDDKLADAFRKAGGRDERLSRALTLAKQDGWTLVDGVPVRKDEFGQVTTVTPDDYFGKAFKTDVPEFFKGTQGSGGGAGGTTGGAGPTGPSGKNPTQWSSDERRAFIEANGADAYQKALDSHLASVSIK